MAPEIGDRFRLLSDFGNQEFDPQGGVRHGLPAGAIGVVGELVAAGTKGAHNEVEDAAVCIFEDEARSVGFDGAQLTVPIVRRIAFSITQFDPVDPNCIFEAAP